MEIKELTLGQMITALEIYNKINISKNTFDELEKVKGKYEACDSSLEEKVKGMTLGEIVNLIKKLKEQINPL